ncbi:MAG: hypothetical protein WCM76_01715 [Bacteroidota bacterium]
MPLQNIKAEINAGSSIEWLCASADIVATGKITSVCSVKGQNGITGCVFKVSQYLKGNASGDLYFYVPWFASDSLQKLKKNESEIIVFLKKADNIYTSGNKTFDYIVMESYNSVPALAKLEKPQKAFISAANFKLLTTGTQILECSRKAISRMQEYTQTQQKEIKRHYLEIPYNTDAWDLLYSGSSCFLYVPAFMFPESNEDFY